MSKAPRTTLARLAKLVGGTAVGIEASAITDAKPLDELFYEAQSGVITLVDSPDRVERLRESGAAAAVVPPGVEADGVPLLVVEDVHAAFSRIVRQFRPARAKAPTGVHPTAVIAASASVAADVTIGPYAIVGEGSTIESGAAVGAHCVVGDGCQVGEGAKLFPRVTLYEGTVVGDRCQLHSGVVIGSFGFGYRQKEGKHTRAAQLGNVEIADDVEIGAGTTIDRGAYGPTRIGKGTKIDNLVQIAHNCQIGRHNLICSQVGIAGSTTTGDYVVMAGQVGVRDHVRIGDRAVISAMAGVPNDVPEDAVMLGAPAKPVREQKMQFAAMAKLPEMRKEFKAMRRELKELQEQLAPKQKPTDRAA
ncbi:UDP-3-O-acylglucosamine N-acyltransferase [Pseudobythopirellula maris]|uniref:UDP-3-O-acylglucosamine N-acyltransferase n=1 Tax=Pseudobythopirellula maris TaxID=2527991 RepID=A0A5C5ZN16_9BACT|nr:UDP-3-O-(3-hydroxymyristoyl)glucosamine N-acyltransferase [Pseudobythopirellula maris]TWT88560.1 UDP-3-O-acylglucosamine N-acyltransferase [Pseudobythopirellula maris]